MLRSTPCGRDGLVAGNSPAAIRSVQSPNKPLALFGPSSLMRASMVVMACPETTRRAQASAEELKWPSSLGIVRVALLPSWWHVIQPFVLTTFNHSPWLATLPVGNSFLSGILSIEYQ